MMRLLAQGGTNSGGGFEVLQRRGRMVQEETAAGSTLNEVANLYDRLTALTATKIRGNNLHFGYWDDPDSDIPIEEAANRLTDIMTEKLQIGPGSHVLDVGCGVGGPGVRIAQLTGARVTGISISQEQVALANSLAESAGISGRVVFRRENAMEMSFCGSFFDAVIAIESMQQMPDREQVLTHICRSLRPGGRLVLTDAFVRGTIPAEKLPVIDRFRNSFMFTMVQAEDYPPILRRAGLWFEEILDISDQTMQKSMSWLSRQHGEMRPQLNAVLGDEMTELLDTTELVDIPELGYLMVVAKRPKE